MPSSWSNAHGACNSWSNTDNSGASTTWTNHADDGSGSCESWGPWTGDAQYTDHLWRPDHRADGESGWKDSVEEWSKSSPVREGWGDCTVGEISLQEYLDAEFARRMQAHSAVAEELQRYLRAAEAELVENQRRFEVMGEQILDCLSFSHGLNGQVLGSAPVPVTSQSPQRPPPHYAPTLNGQLGSVPAPVISQSPQPTPYPRCAPTTITCKHHSCNISAEVYKEVELMQVTNGYSVETSDELWSMTLHLTSTVLQYHGGLAEKLQDTLSKYLPRFNIIYCKAKDNRCMLVQCKACGCGLYCRYRRYNKEDEETTVAAIAAFLGVELPPQATQV